jgi:hypothetical protein
MRECKVGALRADAALTLLRESGFDPAPAPVLTVVQYAPETSGSAASSTRTVTLRVRLMPPQIPFQRPRRSTERAWPARHPAEAVHGLPVPDPQAHRCADRRPVVIGPPPSRGTGRSGRARPLPSRRTVAWGLGRGHKQRYSRTRTPASDRGGPLGVSGDSDTDGDDEQG